MSVASAYSSPIPPEARSEVDASDPPGRRDRGPPAAYGSFAADATKGSRSSWSSTRASLTLRRGNTLSLDAAYNANFIVLAIFTKEVPTGSRSTSGGAAMRTASR